MLLGFSYMFLGVSYIFPRCFLYVVRLFLYVVRFFLYYPYLYIDVRALIDRFLAFLQGSEGCRELREASRICFHLS